MHAEMYREERFIGNIRWLRYTTTHTTDFRQDYLCKSGCPISRQFNPCDNDRAPKEQRIEIKSIPYDGKNYWAQIYEDPNIGKAYTYTWTSGDTNAKVW